MNWADSSDDEDEAFFAPENNPPEPDTESEPEPEPEPEPVRPKKEFVMPENPPFTAFVGNLAFSVKEGDELGRKISDLVKTRFGKEITVTASRVALDRRENNKHKGFGYVEVETVDDLKAVLELNDGLSNIAGRAIHLDVAQPSNKNNRRESSNSMRSQHSFGSTGGDVDGSKFQGGRYNNKGSFRRQNSDNNNNNNNSGAPAQRPSLKLQPRSRSKTEGDASASASNIFGGGKAREGGSNWDNNRRSSSSNSINNNNKDEKGNNERRTSSRGGGRGGGSGRGGRGGGRGNSNNKPPSRQSSTASRGSVKGENKKEEQRRKPPPAAVETEAAPPTKKVVNKFAALGFSDSDDE